MEEQRQRDEDPGRNDDQAAGLGRRGVAELRSGAYQELVTSSSFRPARMSWAYRSIVSQSTSSLM